MRKPIQMKPVAAVPPLRARKKEDDSLYVRRPAVEQLLEQLITVEIEEIARRAEILDQQDVDYLPPEVLVHYLRRLKNAETSQSYRSVFLGLRKRLLQRLPVRNTARSGSQATEDRYQADVRDQVVDRVMEILCEDRNGYDVRLDYYEVNFNGAVAKARKTAKKKVSKKNNRENSQSLSADLNPDEAAEVDAAISSIRGVSENSSDVLYRSEWLSAINTLPDEEREVILMLVEGFKIKEIAETVGCTEKTVSARRNRARAKLRAEMNVEVKS